MNRTLSLARREWFQYRFGWSLMLLVPLTIAVLVLTFGEVHVDVGDEFPKERPLAVVLAFATTAGSMMVLGGIAWIQSVFLVTGLARRDFADRSAEFWLSLPTGHGAALGVPLFVHLIVVPAAALVTGLAIGLVLSVLVVSRVEGIGAWLALPWGDLSMAGLALTLRLLAGLPLLTLWLAPLVLAAVLMVAWFRRWGLVILAVLLAFALSGAGALPGQAWLAQMLGELAQNAGQALVGASRQTMVARSEGELQAMLGLLPRWAFDDFVAALGRLASPLFIGALILAAACFAGLVDWRRRSATSIGA